MSISVGIDVGSSAVRVAVLRVAYRKTTVEALVSVNVTAVGGVKEAIQEAYAQALAGKPSDGIATSIEGTRASVHTLALPASAQKQFGEVLPFELEAALPVDMSESVFDYRVLEARPARDGSGCRCDAGCGARGRRAYRGRARADRAREERRGPGA